MTDDPGIKDALGFQTTREIAHQKSFEKAVDAIENNFASGNLPGIEMYANVYVNTSQGEGDMEGPWNSGDQWDRIDNLAETMSIDGGDGLATIGLNRADSDTLAELSARTMSDPTSEPTAGVDPGAEPGAGRITGDDKGGAANIATAVEMAAAEL